MLRLLQPSLACRGAVRAVRGVHGVRGLRAGLACRPCVSRAFCSAEEEEKQDVTWANQDSLPRLPVPELEATAEEYRRMVRPLLSTKARHATDQNIDWFKTSSKVAGLQKELHALDEASPTSWLEGFWDTMYLEQRSSLLVNTSPYFALADPPFPAFSSADSAQVERAAGLTHAIFAWAEQLWERQLAPDAGLCMAQYQRLLGVARVPMPGRDQMWSTARARDVAVLARGHVFRLQVDDGSGRLLPRPALRAALRQVVGEAERLEAPADVPLLTAGSRERWAEARALLCKDRRNERALEAVQKALFVLCLDAQPWASLEESGRQLLHGEGGRNRWMDKLQVVVAANGRAGLVLEHAPVDGHTALRLASDVHALEAQPEAGGDHQEAHAERLEWHVQEPVLEAVREAADVAAGLAGRTETAVLHADGFGKAAIKRAGLSPDGFVQMAFQLAYYRAFGRVVSTYESAMTKRFLHGRTETIRSVSDESLAYCAGFSRDQPAESAALLRAAVDRHVQTSADAAAGRGVDRHLFVLHQLAQQQRRRLPGHEIPDLFRDPAYATFCSNVLSTSNCGGDALVLFGFGPVHEDGLGVGYIIKDNDITVTVTSFHEPNAKTFAEHLDQALKDQMEVAKEQ